MDNFVNKIQVKEKQKSFLIETIVEIWGKGRKETLLFDSKEFFSAIFTKNKKECTDFLKEKALDFCL